MTHLLRRRGLNVALCTVDRLMKDLAMSGVRRGKRPRTTIPTKDGQRAGDLLDRNFTAAGPNRVWVADFTYVRTWAGFAYVAFIVDVFAQRIVAWHAATDKRTGLVLTPLRMALWDRDRLGHRVEPGQLIHHHDAGSQGGFNWSSQHRDSGGGYGTASGLDGGVDGSRADAVAGCAVASPGGRAGVLARDCQGTAA